MRVIFKGLLMALILAFIWMNGEILWSSRLYLNAPRIHTIRKGEYLSRIAQQYYGKAVYWKALALINRAPQPNRVFPGEKILLPDAAAVARIAKARRLSQVNALLAPQEQQAQPENSAEVTEFNTRPGRPMAKLQPQPVEKARPAMEAQPKPETQMKELAAVSGTAKSVEPAPDMGDGGESRAESLAEALPQQPVTPPAPQKSWIWPVLILLIIVVGGGYAFYRRRQQEPRDEEEIPEPELLWEEMEQKAHAMQNLQTPSLPATREAATPPVHNTAIPPSKK